MLVLLTRPNNRTHETDLKALVVDCLYITGFQILCTWWLLVSMWLLVSIYTDVPGPDRPIQTCAYVRSYYQRLPTRTICFTF
jgi:hypothetical protein